jgi:hypothetical protein
MPANTVGAFNVNTSAGRPFSSGRCPPAACAKFDPSHPVYLRAHSRGCYERSLCGFNMSSLLSPEHGHNITRVNIFRAVAGDLGANINTMPLIR